MTTETYRVSGMTCDHCVRAVTEEAGRLPGVGNVSVGPAARTVTVWSATS